MDFVSSDVEATLRTIFRRCLQCPPTTPPCPACASGEICSLSTPSCNQCQVATCVKSGASGQTVSSPSKGGGSVNAGAIAGGVIGGVVAVAIITFLVWKFCIKNKRGQYEDEWPEDAGTYEKGGDDFAMRRNARASTHTVGSIASTAFTRASNVIQIAYIPGVTNRSPPSTPGVLVPPVPPLPLPTTSTRNTSPNIHQDQHFFMPGDLRDSTYSGITDDGRSSIARTSISPSLARSSVATTIYRNNAVVDPMPAQTVIRGKAAVVSVKSSSDNSPSETPGAGTPPVPAIDFGKHGQTALRAREPSMADDVRPPPSPAFSIGSTFLKSTANTAKAMTPRPVNLTKGSNTKVPTKADFPGESSSTKTIAFGGNPQRQKSLAESTSAASSHSRARRYNANSGAFDDSSDEEDEPHSRAKKSLMGRDRESRVTVIDDSPAIKQSPFSDTESVPSPELPQTATHGFATPKATASGHKKSGSLSAVIEEATRKASEQPTHGGLGSISREPSPFSDENEVKLI